MITLRPAPCRYDVTDDQGYPSLPLVALCISLQILAKVTGSRRPSTAQPGRWLRLDEVARLTPSSGGRSEPVLATEETGRAEQPAYLPDRFLGDFLSSVPRSNFADAGG